MVHELSGSNPHDWVSKIHQAEHDRDWLTLRAIHDYAIERMADCEEEEMEQPFEQVRREILQVLERNCVAL